MLKITQELTGLLEVCYSQMASKASAADFKALVAEGAEPKQRAFYIWKSAAACSQFLNLASTLKKRRIDLFKGEKCYSREEAAMRAFVAEL